MYGKTGRQAQKRGIRSIFYKASSVVQSRMVNGKPGRAGVGKRHIHAVTVC